jgi:aminopeptidase N
MQWFNDALWMKVFNFMAENPRRWPSKFELRPQIRHRPLPAACGIDRTAGPTHPQPLTSLQDAGFLRQHHLYHKAPMMMRQLERRWAPQPSNRTRCASYLQIRRQRHLARPHRILDARTPADLQAWNQVGGEPMTARSSATTSNQRPAASQLALTSAPGRLRPSLAPAVELLLVTGTATQKS